MEKSDNVKAIRKGISIEVKENEALKPNNLIVAELRQLTLEAEKGMIQQLAYCACGVPEVNKFGLVGISINPVQMGHQLRGLNFMFDEEAFAPFLYNEENYEDDE